MQRQSIFISLPIICAISYLGAGQRSAFAGDTQAEQATQLLARSQVLDSKCSFLASSEHEQLTNLVARAELALAGRIGVDTTKQALARGRAEGQAATCTESERADLNNILNSASQAASMAPKTEPKMEVAAAQQEPQVKAEPEPKPVAKTKRVKVVLPASTQPVAKPKTKTNAALLQYASITEKYYVARRCGSMSSKQIQSFYQSVVSSHQQVLSDFGRSAVANVMSQSESKANAQSCS
jgi:hypothetical protein